MNKKEFELIPENERFNCVLEGEAYYASVHTPNMSAVKKFNADPFFGISLTLEGDQLEKAKEMGLNVRDANDSIPKPFVVIKRKVKEGKTADEVRPSVVDEMQNPIPKNILIGNGSVVLVKFATYWYEAGGGGVGTTFFKTQVKDLVAYNPDNIVDPDLEMNKDGFNINDYLEQGAGAKEEEVADDGEVEETPLKEPTTKKASKAKAKATVGATNPDIFDE